MNPYHYPYYGATEPFWDRFMVSALVIVPSIFVVPILGLFEPSLFFPALGIAALLTLTIWMYELVLIPLGVLAILAGLVLVVAVAVPLLPFWLVFKLSRTIKEGVSTKRRNMLSKQALRTAGEVLNVETLTYQEQVEAQEHEDRRTAPEGNYRDHFESSEATARMAAFLPRLDKNSVPYELTGNGRLVVDFSNPSTVDTLLMLVQVLPNEDAKLARHILYSYAKEPFTPEGRKERIMAGISRKRDTPVTSETAVPATTEHPNQRERVAERVSSEWHQRDESEKVQEVWQSYYSGAGVAALEALAPKPDHPTSHYPYCLVCRF